MIELRRGLGWSRRSDRRRRSSASSVRSSASSRFPRHRGHGLGRDGGGLGRYREALVATALGIFVAIPRSRVQPLHRPSRALPRRDEPGVERVVNILFKMPKRSMRIGDPAKMTSAINVTRSWTWCWCSSSFHGDGADMRQGRVPRSISPRRRSRRNRGARRVLSRSTRRVCSGSRTEDRAGAVRRRPSYGGGEQKGPKVVVQADAKLPSARSGKPMLAIEQAGFRGGAGFRARGRGKAERLKPWG
jgi:hypothetical protein